jgi:glycosyl hydrolase family 44
MRFPPSPRAAASLLAMALTGCTITTSTLAPRDAGPGHALGDASEGGSHDATVEAGTGTSPETDASDVTTSPGDEAIEPSDAAEEPDAGPPGPVTFAIDVGLGPTRQVQPPTSPTKVSDYVYGINGSNGAGATVALSAKTRWGLIRKGGNGYTTWNWTNNYANLGATGCFAQEPIGGGAALAGAVTQDVDSVSTAQAAGAAYLATVPIVDFVSATFDNSSAASCPTTVAGCDAGVPANPKSVNSNNLDFASTDPASAAFVANAPSKPGGYCTCAPSQACDGGCTVSTSPVYQDEFVNFVKTMYGATAPIFFDLDNEPNYWGSTHPEVWPFTGTLPCEGSTVTYDDIVGRDERYAGAIKAAWPSAKVFGPVVAQDGLVYAHDYYTNPYAPTEFLDFYLGQMAVASSEAGTPLLDALDVQYYNAGTTDAGQCVQNPRMFWDPGYTSLAAVATDDIDFGYGGLNGYFDLNWYPRQIVPRLLRKINTAYPAPSGAAPGLAFSEYNSGCETTIAGAVAEADNLGIFGREGVFAAAAMPLASPTNNYLMAAFDLYRNYDGNGAIVGDTAIAATTTNVDASSIYAFAHAGDASAVDLVAINKATVGLLAQITIAHAPALSTASVFRIVDGAAAVAPAADPAPPVQCANGACTLAYTMPPMSATTLVLR